MPREPDPAGQRSLSKAQARSRLKAALTSMDSAQIVERSTQVCARIEAWPGYRKARSLLVFASFQPGARAGASDDRSRRPSSSAEVDLSSLVQAALQIGKRVCLSRVDWSSRSMIPLWIENWAADLVETRFGVAEPRDGLSAAALGDIELALVPGLGFDRSGNRLGRGGGFYDRFLASPGLHATTCGVCFASQLLPTGEQLPSDPWDMAVASIATENEVIVCSREEGGTG
ncbi:MAG: 5-formyltetrahydrofolate cyclo-ligase [Pyrinomonadaceae bacterium]|nr:5-formyltetrahydrofolate cyclo-ligase [Phycisphaerales bacterium]